MISVRSALSVMTIALFACSEDGGTTDGTVPEDVFRLDAEPNDRGFVDTGLIDSGVDAGSMDVLPVDTGSTSDAGFADAVTMDAVGMDAVGTDAVGMDAPAADAPAPDAPAPDAVFPDADPMDAVGMDAPAPDAPAPDAVIPDAGFMDAAAPDAMDPPDSGFSEFNAVWDIISARCVSCHAFGSGGLMMDSQENAYLNLINEPTNACPGQDRVEPGNATLSGLAHKIGPDHVAAGCGGSRMPASGPPYLSNADIQTIVGWINAGANP